MAGARNVHNRIAFELAHLLGRSLQGKLPRGVQSRHQGPRPAAAALRGFYYPDGMVVCDPNSADETFQDNPVVLAEVILGNHAADRRRGKAEAYFTIPTLMVYLVIETDQPRVVVHRRREHGFQAEGRTKASTLSFRWR